MKKLVILGAGTGGTMMANKLAPKLNKTEWEITLVDQDDIHYYQPGFLFLPFGIYNQSDVIKTKHEFFPKGVSAITSAIDRVMPEANRVLLADGTTLDYDLLIVATGSQIAPSETDGMLGDEWQKSIFDFYTFEGAVALSDFLSGWEGGKMVINITEMPIKCPVAPLEFAFLADWYFTEQGIRDKVEITYVTPLPGAFTKPMASKSLGNFLEQKNIHLISEFNIARVESDANKIVSWDDVEIPYDLLVTIPTNMGSDAIKRSGMGDELNFIPTDQQTLQSKAWENIFVIGDATDIPASKAGSVAHFESEILTENILAFIDDRPMEAKFDGHANCFIETGFKKGMLIDFNYTTEPLPGTFPLPAIGPFSLLKETRLNHYGKMAFRWAYWNLLIKGANLPIPTRMQMVGKQTTDLLTAPISADA